MNEAKILLAARSLTLARFSAQARIAETVYRLPAYRQAGGPDRGRGGQAVSAKMWMVDAGQEYPAYQIFALKEITEDHFIG
jgi:hypothetical protein